MPLVVASCVVWGASSCSHTQPDAVPPTEASVAADAAPMPAPAVKPRPSVDFATQIRPIFEAHCQPCHFSGGIMYERRPFDRPETIHALGEKLFTRIKDEGEQRVIREFLAQKQE